MSFVGYSQESSSVEHPKNPYRLYSKSFLSLTSTTATGENIGSRRKREFTPDDQKDSSYWVKRKRNNEAARRSRQRRRMDEFNLETRAVELLRENEKLKATLSAVQHRFVDLGDSCDRVTANGYPTHWLRRHSTKKQSVPQTPMVMFSAVPSVHPNDEVDQVLLQGNFTEALNLDTCFMFPANTGPSAIPKASNPGNKNFALNSISPYAPLKNNDYSCNRNTAVTWDESAFNLRNYVPNTLDFSPGYSALSEKEVFCLRKQKSAPKTLLEAPPYDEGELKSKSQEPSIWAEHSSNYQDKKAQNNLSTAEKLDFGKSVPFVPYKLRFKSRSSETHYYRRLITPVAANEDGVASNKIHSNPETGNLTRDSRQQQDEVRNYLKPDNTDFSEHSHDNRGKSFNSVFTKLSNTISTKGLAETTEQAKIVAATKDIPLGCVLSGQFSIDGCEKDGKQCQGMLSCYSEDTRQIDENGGLRNQLASLYAEVRHLKNIVLAKTTS